MRSIRRSSLSRSLVVAGVSGMLVLTACTSPPADQGGAAVAGGGSDCSTAAPAAGGQAKPMADGLLSVDEGLALWQQRPAEENRTGVTPTEVVIGSHEPLSGPLAAIAEKPGFDALIGAVNDAGGVYGRKIVIQYEDNGGNPAQAVPAVQKLLQQDQVFALLGSQITAAVQATMGAVAQAGVPEIAPNSSIAEQNSPTAPTRISFQIPGQANGFLAGQQIAQQFPKPKVALIYQNDQFGQETVSGAEKAITAAGGSIVARQPFSLAASSDFTSAVSAAVAGQPDALFIEAQSPQARSIMNSLRGQLGSTVPVWFGTGMGHWYYFDDPNLDGAQGFVFAKPFLDPADPNTATAQKFFTEHGVTYSGTVGGIAWLDIQQVQLLLHALSLAGPDLTREGLLAAFDCGFTDRELSCVACLAPFQIDGDNHWANRNLLLTKWNQATKQVETIGAPVPVDIPQILRQTS